MFIDFLENPLQSARCEIWYAISNKTFFFEIFPSLPPGWIEFRNIQYPFPYIFKHFFPRTRVYINKPFPAARPTGPWPPAQRQIIVSAGGLDRVAESIFDQARVSVYLYPRLFSLLFRLSSGMDWTGLSDDGKSN